MSPKKIIKYSLIGLAVVFIGIQFVPANIENPQTDPALEIQTTPEIKKLLVTSCYDCHSNQVVHRWYADIAPVSFFIVSHVEEGREELNFSEWGNYSLKRQLNKLESVTEQIDADEMPMFSYVLMHPEADLSASAKKQLTDWADNTYEQLDAE